MDERKEIRMTFLCEESCVNTKDGEGWRGGVEYTFTVKEVAHLKEIGHLKRFAPLTNAAIDHLNSLRAPAKAEPTEVEGKPLFKRTLVELKAVAAARGIELPEDVKRPEALAILKE